MQLQRFLDFIEMFLFRRARAVSSNRLEQMLFFWQTQSRSEYSRAGSLNTGRFAAGAEWTIFNPPFNWQRRDVQLLYGSNDMSVGRPSFLRMAGEVLIFPPFLVQVCLLLHVKLLDCKQHMPSLCASFCG